MRAKAAEIIAFFIMNSLKCRCSNPIAGALFHLPWNLSENKVRPQLRTHGPMSAFTIRRAASGDEALMFDLLIELAAYEKLEVFAAPADIARDFFADHPVVFCDLAFVDDKPVGLV